MQTLTLENPHEALTILRLNRPQVRNALSWQMVDELKQALRQIDADSRCKVVLLCAEGRSFCAGMDLADQANPEAIARIIGNLPSGPQAGMKCQEHFAELYTLMRRIQQPLIAAVQGHAYGGGLALALCCDLRIATPSAQFCTQFIRLGLSGCDMGVSYTLPRLIGAGRAHDMMLSARVVDARTAEQWGLVTRLVDEEQLMSEALALAETLCDFSPYGLVATKQGMWSNLNAASLEEAMQIENRNQVLCGLTGDVQEAASAFFEGRKPNFDRR